MIIRDFNVSDLSDHTLNGSKRRSQMPPPSSKPRDHHMPEEGNSDADGNERQALEHLRDNVSEHPVAKGISDHKVKQQWNCDDVQGDFLPKNPLEAKPRKRKQSGVFPTLAKHPKRIKTASSDNAFGSHNIVMHTCSDENGPNERDSEKVTVEQRLLQMVAPHSNQELSQSLTTSTHGTQMHAMNLLQQKQLIRTGSNSTAFLTQPLGSSLLPLAAPMFPCQPFSLSSMLVFQEASRLATAGQLMAPNPLAQQMLLRSIAASQNLGTASAMPIMGANYLSMLPLGPVALPPYAIAGMSAESLPFVQLPYLGCPDMRAGAVGEGGTSLTQKMMQAYSAASVGPEVPLCLPVILALPEDESKLSAYQLLLRNQIEAFSATIDDLSTHARGRNKPISLGQVGIRCRHCCHLEQNRRKKGSAYFPFSLLGLYQAAQNMGSTHFNRESCSQMSDELKARFLESIASKSTVGSGKLYWAQSARKLGLVDTENGIRFIRDMVHAVST